MTDTERDIADIKATLARLEPMLGKIIEGQNAANERLARLEGRMNDAPTARDFGRIEGRLDEISNRLPVPIAYQPPGKQRA